MSSPLRPSSERSSVCCSVPDSGSFCSQDGRHASSTDDDDTPIYSLSKSSMDVVVAPPHLRDPAFSRLDRPRCSSTSEQHCRPNSLQNFTPHPSPLTKRNLEMHNPQALNERCLGGMQRWSSCSAQSRSSTPDTVIFKGSRPSSGTQEKLLGSSKLTSPPSSPLVSPELTPRRLSKLTSPPPSPLVSPELTPRRLSKLTSPPPSPLVSPELTPTKQSKLRSPPPRTPSPLISPELTPTKPSKLRSPSPSPLTSPELTPTVPLKFHLQDDVCLNSSDFSLLQAKYTSPLPARELLCFTFPSPTSSSVSLEKFAAEDPLYAVKNSATEADVDKLFSDVFPGNLGLPFGNHDFLSPDFTNFPMSWKPMLASSFSDPYLGACRRCSDALHKNAAFRDLRRSKKRNDGTMTSQVELVDVGVQTFSPLGSSWSLRQNNSFVGSSSFLGSPPGSLLNLRSPVGSHFNLVSPSSSMFPISSGDEDSDTGRETFSVETSSGADMERRSCLKVRGVNMGRRSSMKQVQWDEDGMTWDVHGASIDPEELNMAIQKHLELKSTEEEQTPQRKSSKKKHAPKPPVQPKPPPTPPPVIKLEGKGKEEEKDRERLVEEEKRELQARRRSLSPGPVQRRKRRMFKRPGWCGGSRKNKD